MSEQKWEAVQIKTFTKWCNNHLKREFGTSSQLEKMLEDFRDGILLMKLAVALYKDNDKNPEQALRGMPKLKARELKATSKIGQVQNCNRALAMLKKAGVKLVVSAENVVDSDKPLILGMVWMIILDYASRGFGGSSAEVKRALLAWVNKQTDGYERVNPPGVKNFSSNWRSGLAWCALIDRHRPGLIDYEECLKQTNAENLELAFSVAEEQCGIPRLLDVEDVDQEHPDDKSVLTYVMEYFLAFAGDGLRETAARQAADWLRFLREIENRKNDYERRARALLAWTTETQGGWTGDFGSSKDEADAIFGALRDYVGTEKPPMEVERMDLEALFAEIQTTLVVNSLAPYVPPEDCTPEKVDEAFAALNQAQQAHAEGVRAAKFGFIEKKTDNSAEDMKQEIKKSFDAYDENHNGKLNKAEFIGGCMQMGVAVRTEEEKDALFNKLAGANDFVSLESFTEWMISRVNLSMDNPESVRNTLKAIAGGNSFMTESMLSTKPLTDEDAAFLKANMPQNDDGGYDIDGFVAKIMTSA